MAKPPEQGNDFDDLGEENSWRASLEPAAVVLTLTILLTVVSTLVGGLWHWILLGLALLGWACVLCFLGALVAVLVVMMVSERAIDRVINGQPTRRFDGPLLVGLVLPALLVLLWAPTAWAMGFDREQWLASGAVALVAAGLLVGVLGRHAIGKPRPKL